MSSAVSATAIPGKSSRLKAVLLSEHFVLGLSLAYFVALAPFTPGFASPNNLANILLTLLPLFIVAVGQTLVLITAGIDLSATSIIALTSVVGAMVMNGDNGWLANHPMAVPVGVLAMLVTGTFAGLLNGVAIAVLRMPAFIVTLTSMMFFSGLAIWITQSKGIGSLPGGFNQLGANLFWAIPVTACVGGFTHLMLSRSLWGHWLYAVGHNSRAAFVSGVPVNGMLVSAYAASGCCAALASVLLTGQGETGSPVLGQRILLDVIGATVIGGTSLFGGKGKVLWTLFGVLFLKLIDNSLNLLSLSLFTVTMVKGGVILFAALLDAARNRLAGGNSTMMPSAPASLADVAALEFREIEKSFSDVAVLKRVSFKVPAGHTLGLVGENGAGKSTLMNLLGGNLAPDAGTIQLAGEPYSPRSPTDATRHRVAFIHQELNLFPNLTVAENLFLTSFPRTAGLPWIHRRRLHERTTALLKEVGLGLPPDTLVERLSAGERQLVEIAKALSVEARLILFDEPTTSLSAREIETLFALMQRLRDRGITIIYISHVLSDVLQLCDDIVVLRDGEVVGQGPRGEFTSERMISLMVGRSLNHLYPTRQGRAGSETLLEVRSVSQPGIVHDITLQLKRGEVLGISGLMGAGRSELARILFGLDPCTSGDIQLNGRSVQSTRPVERIHRGMAFLTEDRRSEGLCMEASIRDNLALVTLREHTRPPLNWIDFDGLRESLRNISDAVRLRARAGDASPVKTLSGGNQQKVVLAKWLLSKPAVLILDEPTRGIDVGAKFEIYQLILDLADAGTGVLIISSEIEELIGLCDRILVMSRGEIKDCMEREEFDRERILRSALEGEVE